jgi:hypothetical protein
MNASERTVPNIPISPDAISALTPVLGILPSRPDLRAKVQEALAPSMPEYLELLRKYNNRPAEITTEDVERINAIVSQASDAMLSLFKREGLIQ